MKTVETILIIARKEMLSLFLSPLAWIVLGTVQLLAALQFLELLEIYLRDIQPALTTQNSVFGVSDFVVGRYFFGISSLLLFVVPLLTMRLVAREKQAGTIALLRAAPISSFQVVLGKFLGVSGFLAVMLFMLGLMPLTLLVGVDLDLLQMLAGLLGLLLMLSAFASIGLFMSCLTREPVVAAISTFGLLLFLVVLGYVSGNEPDALTQWVSIASHLESFLRGMFTTGDLVYYLVVIAAFLAFSARRLDAERLQR